MGFHMQPLLSAASTVKLRAPESCVIKILSFKSEAEYQLIYERQGENFIRPARALVVILIEVWMLLIVATASEAAFWGTKPLQDAVAS